MRSKRLWSGGVILLLALSAACARAEIPDLASRLDILKEAADALGAAGDAITKLTDGVSHLVQTGDKGWEFVSAKRTHTRLVDISARAVSLRMEQRAAVVMTIDGYLAKRNPTPQDWGQVTSHIGSVIAGVKSLIDEVSAERSDFVLQPAYASLVDTLGARSSILQRLAVLPPPATAEEKAELARMNKNYKALMDKFQDAITQLNKYLQSAPAAGATAAG